MVGGGDHLRGVGVLRPPRHPLEVPGHMVGIQKENLKLSFRQVHKAVERRQGPGDAGVPPRGVHVGRPGGAGQGHARQGGQGRARGPSSQQDCNLVPSHPS